MNNLQTKNGESITITDVIHQQWPPNTGSMKCKGCNGWIIGSQCFGINNEYPFCPNCYKEKIEKT